MNRPYGYPIPEGYFGYNYELGRYILYATEEEYIESLMEEDNETVEDN